MRLFERSYVAVAPHKACEADMSDLVFFWAFMPETRGIPLEEVDEYFSRIPVFVPTSKEYVPDAHTREDEMRAGRVRHAAGPSDLEKASHSHDEIKG